MSAETSVYFAVGFVAVMVAVLLAVAVMVILDTLAAWPPRPKHRQSPGAQYWVRSTQTSTAPIVILADGRAAR